MAAGARGATLDQLLAFLGAPSAAGLADFGRRIAHRVLLGDQAASGGPRVLFSGGIWVDASRGGLISSAFQDVAAESYKSEAPARNMSFANGVCYSMYLFLPDERQGIANTVYVITTGPDYLYNNVLNKTAYATVTVTLPKFQISFDRDLADDLRLLGLSLQSADLRGIFDEEDDRGGRPTSLSKLLHKAVVKVNEDGTEAAAVTMGLMVGSGMQLPVEFVADHPFTFFIMEERSGVIVFAGHVLDPAN